MKDIMSQFMVPSVTEKEWAPMIATSDTQVRFLRSTMTSVLQAWQKAATPAGDLTLAPLERNLSKLKYETDIDPDTIDESWAGFLADIDSNDRKNWPITRYIADQLMMLKGREDWELSAVMKGVYVAPTPGTPGNVADSHDGILQQIVDDITATNITAVAGPASWSATDQTALEDLLTWIKAVKAVSENVRNIVDGHCREIFCSTTLAQKFHAGMCDKYNVNYQRTEIDLIFTAYKFKLPYHNLVIVGLPSMNGSNRIIMTPPINRYCRIKRPNSEASAELYMSGPREIVAFSDFHKQVSYKDPQYMYVNQLT